MIRSRHPSWLGSVWKKYADCYVGGESFLAANYLFQHVKEDPRVFQGRKERAYYLNYLRPLVEFAIDFIYQYGVIERSNTEGQNDFVDNVDRKGSSINNFMAQAGLWAVIKGMSYIAVDNLAPRLDLQSRADETALGLGPYWYLIQREDMLNWALDDFGNLIWALIKEDAPANPNPFAITQPGQYDYFLLWTTETWERLRAERQQIVGGQPISYGGIETYDYGQNTLGRVTIEPFYGRRVGDWLGESWIADLCRVAINLFNVCSLRDNYNYETAIEQLVIHGISEDQKKNFTIGDRYIIAAPENAKPAYYVGPSGVAAEILQKQILDLQTDMARMMRQRLINSGAVSDAASGASKSWDFVTTNTGLVGLADEFERVENSLHKMTILYRGMGAKVITAQYPDSFDVNAIDQELARITEMETQAWPDEVMMEIKKKWLRKAFNGEPEILAYLERAVEDQGSTERNQASAMIDVLNNLKGSASVGIKSGASGEQSGQQNTPTAAVKMAG